MMKADVLASLSAVANLRHWFKSFVCGDYSYLSFVVRAYRATGAQLSFYYMGILKSLITGAGSTKRGDCHEVLLNV